MVITSETVVEKVTYAKNIKEKDHFVFFDFPYEGKEAHVKVKNDLSLIEVTCDSMSKELQEGFEQELKEKLTRLA